MKTIFKAILLFFLICPTPEIKAQNVVTSDIDRFWEAYGKITATKDSTLQHKYLEDLYLSKGTEGLNAIRQARNYTAQDYINAINNYPLFWASIKPNTLKAKKSAKELEAAIGKLHKIYPSLQPAKIYFTIGALRTNGTFSNNLVLIGSEIAMADKNTITSEFPENIQKGRRDYFDSNPIDHLILLNVHEYVHTQQKPVTHSLLSYVLNEGVAEFVSVKAMGVASAVPAINYGKHNAEKIRARFEQEMFYLNNQHKWLWSDAPNDFGTRDLGYYVGYQICENVYNQAKDKKAAIKKMIELDYNDEAAIEAFVDGSNFFSKPLAALLADFEASRPAVVGIKEFENNSSNVSPKIAAITFQFSEALNGFNTGVDYGALGPDAFPKNNVGKRYWAEDKRSWTIPVTLEPNKKYQFLITTNFRNEKNVPLKEFLVEFQTGD